MTAAWPVELRGITESVITTQEPGGRWNAAALGLHAGDPITARTWGDTRTRRNLERDGSGYVQFVRDPVVFVEVALGIHEQDDPVLPSADAWAEVEAERMDAGTADGTQWVEWALSPRQTEVRQQVVPTVNRGFNAVIEATVAASRLDVAGYDDGTLHERLDYLREVTRRCGGERDRAAMNRLDELAGDR